jgi:hypothetical protein
MNLIKKITLIVLGVFIAFVLGEIILSFFPPEKLKSTQINDKDFFKWAYLDIHDSFFKIDKNKFYVQREDCSIPEKDTQKKYDYIKNKKRIFILGESTAKFYPEENLQNILTNYFDCDVINSGMGAYDSYRIEKISKEISKLKPDWIICFIGNNDEVIEDIPFKGQPFSFKPIDINYISYKYSAFSKYHTLYLLSNLAYKEIKFETQMELENFFKNNVLKIIKNLKNSKIIFIDLPNNKDFYSCSNIYDIIEIENNGTRLWKETNHYNILLKRLKFIEELRKRYNNVFYTNLTDILLDYCDNKLGYNIFKDDCHWTNATYELLSEIIAKIIIKEDIDKDVNIKISKDIFNKSLMKDTCHLSENYGAIDYIIKHNFDNLYNNYISQIKELENNFTDTSYNNICLYGYCLYKNGYKDLSLQVLNNLIYLQPNYPEAYLTIGYIYYKQSNTEKAKEYFDIVKKLEPDNKISVEYLKSLEKTK